MSDQNVESDSVEVKEAYVVVCRVGVTQEFKKGRLVDGEPMENSGAGAATF